MPTSSAIWHVPYQRNPFFTGRDEVLTRIHAALQTDATVALSHPQGISGLGGIGKTQMVLEYAYRYRADYQTVLWANAESSTTLTSEFLRIASVLHLPERNEQQAQRIVEAVMRWLHVNSHWLLVLDNVEDITIVEPFIPLAASGHILLTTRTWALSQLAQRIEIETMSLEVGALFLLRRAGMVSLLSSLDEAAGEDRTLALQMTQEMDGLPLALDQAGAYIRETPCSLATYLARYQARNTDLLQLRDPQATYPESVATTWSLSFEKITQTNAAATELLHLMAVLYPDGIPEEVVTDAAEHMGTILGPMATHPLRFDLALKEILRYSLVYRDPDAQTLTVHRLVQTIFQQHMGHEYQFLWAIRAVQAMNTIFPGVEFATWARCQRYIVQAQRCAELVQTWDMTFVNAARLLNQAGVYLRVRARYAEAEPLFQQALIIWQQALGSSHSHVAACFNNLALLYAEQGTYEQAEQFYLLALAIWQQADGQAEQANIAIVCCNLGRLYLTQGNYAEAESLFKDALILRQHLYGAEHPETASVLHNLAELSLAQGQYSQAESYYQQAGSIRERHFGRHHPETIASLNGLARVYQRQGRYAQAEVLLREILPPSEAAFGLQHPEVATILHNLALVLEEQGKYAQVEQLYQRALVIREQRLGLVHPNVVATLNSFAGLYTRQGKYEQAEPLYQRALTIYEQAVGLEHHHTASVLNNLADLYRSQEKYAQAEQFYQKALKSYEQAVGNGHPDTVATLGNLALVYQAQKRYAEAEQLTDRVITLQKQTLGTEHPRVAVSMHNLAGLYRVQGKYEQAEQLYRQVLTIWEHTLEPTHIRIANTLHNLALVYVDQGKYEQAEELYQQAWALLQQIQSVDHPDTLILLNNYADLLERAGRTDAKTALLAQYLILKQQKG